MKKVKIIAALAICIVFGANALAAGKHYNYDSRHMPQQKQAYKKHKNVKVVKYAPAKPKRHYKPVQKTVVVHHYEEPRHNHTAEAVAIVGLGIIATAAIAQAIF
jgi:hypothetical protein